MGGSLLLTSYRCSRLPHFHPVPYPSSTATSISTVIIVFPYPALTQAPDLSLKS